MSLSTRVLRTFEDIEDVRGFWEKEQWHPYADIDYYLRFAGSAPGFIEPHVVLLTGHEQPLALMIGWIREAPLTWKVGYKTVYRAHVRSLEIAYGGILGDTTYSNCGVLVQEILNCLTRGEADIAFFKFIRSNSPLFKVATDLPDFLFRDHFPLINPHWKLSLNNSFDEFYQQRSKNTKSNIRKYANRMKKGFGDSVSVKCFREKTDVDQGMSDIETIAAQTYHRKLRVGFFNTPETRSEWMFAADRGWLRAYVLYLQNLPCSFLTAYAYNRVFYVEAHGFNPSYEYYHPGMFLFMRTIEDLCSDPGIDSIDFGFGDADYKRNYGDQSRNDAAVYIFAPTLRGIKFNLTRSLTILVSKFAKTTLRRLKILGKVKTKWRRQLTSSKGNPIPKT